MIRSLGGHETYLHTKFQLSSPNSKASRFQKPCGTRFLIKVYCRGRSMSEQLGPSARLRCTLSGLRPICGATAPVFAPVQIEGQAPLSYFSSPFSCCCCGCCCSFMHAAVFTKYFYFIYILYIIYIHIYILHVYTFSYLLIVYIYIYTCVYIPFGVKLFLLLYCCFRNCCCSCCCYLRCRFFVVVV